MLTAAINTLTPRVRLNFLKPTIENIVFKLHYQLTVTILIAFVILVCAREYFGAHIQCISDQGVPDHVIQTYCFFMATFTIVRHYNESLLQTGFLPHPGVGPIMESDETLHHTYYQWVPFVLFIQSICFYMPHYVWKKKEDQWPEHEPLSYRQRIVKLAVLAFGRYVIDTILVHANPPGGRIKALVDGLQYATMALESEDLNFGRGTIPSKQTLENRLESIRKDIILRLRITRTWSTWLVAMEVTNLLHVMLQIWLINVFLNGQFIPLGGKILWFDDWNQIADPLETVFPKVTKCIFHKYGPSGSIQQHDALCVMGLNIIHEKIYTVLWFWLLFLFIASALAVIWRIASFFLYRRSLRFNQLMFRRVNSSKFNPYNVIQVVNGCEFGDWLFLYYLAKNMHGFVFTALFTKLAEELEKREVADDVQGHQEKGTEPVLISRVDYDDETLPLKEDKKLS